MQTEIAELTERCMELQEQAATSKRLKDEVDELNYRLTNTGQLKDTVRIMGYFEVFSVYCTP